MPAKIEHDYTYNDKSDVWIWNDGKGIDYSDGSEAYLKEVIAKAGGVSAYPIEMAAFIKDWPSRYHLSHRRINVLEGIKEIFGTDRSVLELGAGTGVITRWLADHFGAVDAIEGNLQRAEVNRARSAGLSNVRVLVGDMIDAPFPKGYDFVTQIGSLEYVPLYQEGDPRASCTQFLTKVRKSLASDGTYVLAIENRWGLKYWSGCGEDHTGGFGDGLAGYPDESAKTFSRNELERMLEDAGFGSIEFYHLFPDYKLASVLIKESEDALKASPHHWFRGFAEDYGRERLYVLPDPVVLESLTKDSLLWHFSNSFLVVCSADPAVKRETDWLIKKFSNKSKPELHHTITLSAKDGGGYTVRRNPIYAGEKDVDFGKVRFMLEDADYIAGESMISEAYKALLSRHWKVKIAVLLQELSEELVKRYHHGQVDQEGYPLVDGSAVDFTLWNLVRKTGGEIEFIDKKWTYRDLIPADYVLFRNLFWLLHDFNPFVKDKDIPEVVMKIIKGIYPKYDISRQEENYLLEDEFQNVVSDDPSSLEQMTFGARSVKDNVEHLKYELTHRDLLIEDLESGNKNLQARLNDIYNSRSWKLVSAYSKVVDKILPKRRKT